MAAAVYCNPSTEKAEEGLYQQAIPGAAADLTSVRIAENHQAAKSTC